MTEANKKIKVLIIEDEAMLQEAYRHILMYKGYDVSVASDGIEGIKQLNAVKPHVVILDVLMPKLDGIGFLQQSNIKEKFPHIKVIACTNLSDQVTADQMFIYGADRQVLKSDLSPSQLVGLVEEMVNEG
jgi:DNA-binding NarL/FixJ family response regulator